MAKKQAVVETPPPEEDVQGTPPAIADLEADALSDPAVQEVMKRRPEVAAKMEPPKEEAQAEKPSDESPAEEEATEATPEVKETEAKEGDEETPLDDQLAKLSSSYRIDPSLLADCETIEEAERFIDRIFRVAYSENGQAPMPPHEEPDRAKAEAPKLKATDAMRKQLREQYDEDDPNLKNFEALWDRQDAAEAAHAAELKRVEDRYRQQEESQQEYAKQLAAHAFYSAMSRQSPELFGTEKVRSPRQVHMLGEATQAANIIMHNLVSNGLQVPEYDALATQVMKRAFSDEVAKTKQTAKRTAIEKRQAKRSVGAPARVAQNGRSSSTKVYEGPMEEDPELLEAVRSVRAKYA